MQWTLAGEQRDVDLLDHLDAVQHLGERGAAERLRGVPHGRVGHARALRLQVEHVVARAHRLRAATTYVLTNLLSDSCKEARVPLSPCLVINPHIHTLEYNHRYCAFAGQTKFCSYFSYYSFFSFFHRSFVHRAQTN